MITNDIVSMVNHWSEVFNLPCADERKFATKERVKFALSLIEEEYKETYQAAAEQNLKEYQDGLGDLLWVTIRAMMESGIDPLTTIQRIYDSNMSKADYTKEDAMITKAKYDALGIPTYIRQYNDTLITCRLSDNKVLKSHNFKEPEF